MRNDTDTCCFCVGIKKRRRITEQLELEDNDGLQRKEGALHLSGDTALDEEGRSVSFSRVLRGGTLSHTVCLGLSTVRLVSIG